MAFADDIALYALGYWSHEQHPFRINSICLNTKQRKTPCRECTDICPQGIVLHSGKAIWNGCTNCNLCVTACPTSAINQSSTSFEAIRRLIEEGSAPVSFACERNEEACDARCICLATIPWDLAAAAALSCGLVLKASNCQNCPHELFVSKVKDLIHSLRHFLGKEQFSQTVYMHDQPDKMRKSGIDKRMAFNRIAGNVAQGAEAALQGQKNPTMSCYRALLLDVLSQREQEGRPASVTWTTLTEDGKCHACEICTKLCPHEALELQIPGYTDKDTDSTNEEDQADVDTAQEEQGALSQMLFHNASKCTQCGLCYISCPSNNLDGWIDLPSSTVPAIQAWPIDVSLCAKCGRPFKPKDESETLCIACNRPKFGVARTIKQ